jgi:hypothetical protein
MYWHNLILLMMSTCCSKHVQAWNKYIEKECVKFINNQNGFGCHYFNQLIDFHKYWYEYCHCITLRSRGGFTVKLKKLKLQGLSLTWPLSKTLGRALTKPQKCLEILQVVWQKLDRGFPQMLQHTHKVTRHYPWRVVKLKDTFLNYQ